MNKVYSKLLLAAILMASVLSFSACGSDDDTDDKNKELENKELVPVEQSRYEEFVTPEIENTLKNVLGVDLHRGVNPPNVEGHYLIKTYMTKSTIKNDTYLGYRLTDFKVKLYNQNNLAIDLLGYEVSIDTDIKRAEHTANGTFITGKGNYFSIFFKEETTYVGDNYVTTAMTVLMGEVDRDENNTIIGIKNAQYVYMMIDNNGRPLTMVNGSARLFEDEYASVITKERFELLTKAKKDVSTNAIHSPTTMADLK